MTSFRQIEANRRNALRSTGPITEAGKHRSRRNAVRHGLCAETVVGTLEDIEDYKGFEAANFVRPARQGSFIADRPGSNNQRACKKGSTELSY